MVYTAGKKTPEGHLFSCYALVFGKGWATTPSCKTALSLISDKYYKGRIQDLPSFLPRTWFPLTSLKAVKFDNACMKISKEVNTEIDKIQVLSFKEDTRVKFKNSKLMILIMNKTKDTYE